MSKFFFSIVAAMTLAMPAWGFGRIDRGKFHIFSSVQEPQGFNSEELVKAAADCGLDLFAANFSRQGLDFCQKYGIGAIVRSYLPGWWGGNAQLNGKFATLRPTTMYEKLLRDYPQHPAVVGFEIGDEPSALDFEHYGKVAAVVERYTTAYLNLFPSYASSAAMTGEAAKSQLGARDYEEYLALYCKYVPIGDICFDSYVWGWRNTPSVLLENLRIAAAACQTTGRSLVVELQLLTFKEGDKLGKGPLTENNLRYQCNAALAFGARQINWINWWGKWWTDHILDNAGNIVNPEMYERLKRVNRGLRRQGDVLVRYARTHTDFVNFDNSGNGLRGVRQATVKASDGEAFTGVCASDGAPLLVGHFRARSAGGGQALCIVAADDPQDNGEKSHLVRFRADGSAITVIGETGEVKPRQFGNVYEVSLRSNHALVITAERQPKPQKSLKVLMIGNSYTTSASRQMPQIAKAMGCRLDLFNLAIGGATMELHVKNIAKAEADPKFTPYFARISWTSRPFKATKLAKVMNRDQANVPEVLKAEKWDIVTIQQASPLSSFYHKWQPHADQLIAKIRELAPQAEIRLQETWSWSPYNEYQRQWKMTPYSMYARIHESYGQLSCKYGFKVIPTGAAVDIYRRQLPVKYGKIPSAEELKALREPAVPDFFDDVVGSAGWRKNERLSQEAGKEVRTLSIDNIHLNRAGEYLQGCVWVAALFGVDVTNCKYRDEQLSEERAAFLRKCAMTAVGQNEYK